jgi:3-oxoacyl-[acyl-carrier protein] reductase
MDIDPVAERRLDGRVAVITGGTGGIGAASARRLAAAGASVVVGYHANADAARRLVGELPGTGHRAVRVAMEDSSTLTALADLLRQSYGRADILVNSAGFTRAIPHANLDQLDDATIDAIFVSNVRGPFATIRALAPLLKASGDGVIVNVSSVAAIRGTGSNIAYAGSKAALDTMTLSLARVLGPEIRLICVSPAGVDTPFVPGRSYATLEQLANKAPLKRVTTPDHVARAIMAAIIDMPLSTGIRIVIDGGQTLIA